MANQIERYELWREGGSDTFFAADNDSVRELLGFNVRLVLVVEAASWEEAQQKRYDFMEWGLYRRVEDEPEVQ